MERGGEVEEKGVWGQWGLRCLGKRQSEEELIEDGKGQLSKELRRRWRKCKVERVE